MAAGLACVATDAGGPRDILEDGVTGLLVAPGDAAALADALGRLHRDAELRRRLGAAAAAVALQQFSADRAATAVADVYDRLVGGGLGEPGAVVGRERHLLPPE